jgi:hypothetical protein
MTTRPHRTNDQTTGDLGLIIRRALEREREPRRDGPKPTDPDDRQLERDLADLRRRRDELDALLAPHRSTPIGDRP